MAMDNDITDEQAERLARRVVKIWENRVRRMATRRGCRLAKSRARDTGAVGYGLYAIADAETNFNMTGEIGGTIYHLTLAEAQDWLEGMER